MSRTIPEGPGPWISDDELRHIEARVGMMAERHREDTKRGGCTCGFCAWSPQHVAIMAYREAMGRP